MSNAHVYKYLETPNANPKISNKKLLGSGSVVRDVKHKFEKNNITPRKNAVLCIEAVLSLSPDFFQSNANTKDFAINARKWLMKDFTAMNEVWDSWVENGFNPARACVEARMARPELLVEMSCIAAVS